MPTFSEAFAVTRRRQVGGGSKTNPADQIEWAGELEGRAYRLRSTVRLLNPLACYFMTHSGARIHFARDFSEWSGHFVDLVVL